MKSATLKNLRNEAVENLDGLARYNAQRIDEAAAAVAPSYEELRQQVELLKADLTALVSTAREAGSVTARQAYNAASDAGAKAASTVGHTVANVAGRVDGALATAEDYVREKPSNALGLAAAAGFVFALLMAGRR